MPGSPSRVLLTGVGGCLMLLLGCGRPAGSVGSTFPEQAHGHSSRSKPDVVDPATTGSVTLAELLVYAHANSPTLAVAQQRINLGDAEVAGADAPLYNPNIGVTVGGRTTAGVSRFEFGVQVQQRIQIAGERSARVDAAERSKVALHAAADVAAWEVHVLVHALYYRILVRRRQVQLARRLDKFGRGVSAIMAKRVRSGEESPLQMIVAKAERARARRRLIAAKQAVQVSVLDLAANVGWPASIPLRIEGKLGPRGEVPATASLTRAALRKHPSKRWLQMEIRAAEARVEREERVGSPEPTVGLRYGREAEADSIAHVWTGTLQVPIPIWQKNQRGRALARAQLGVARAKHRAFARTVGLRIASAAARVRAAESRTRLFGGELLPALDKNLAKLKRAFDLGEIGVLEVAQIQERILVTQAAALEALDDYYSAVAALEALSGVDILARAGKRQ